MNAGQEPIHPAVVGQFQYYGLTKREYFAALAFQPMIHTMMLQISNPGLNIEKLSQKIAEASVELADKLIVELAKDRP